ncbi:STAS domain-containing protein [Amycolatopsis sp. NBC_01488]|uniref:STAS domain-containing protein n=1 Tax=Amycolatopsis sp. NBC_01488 TaxID=2903563 RepID=UPI002E2C3B52|nr:hypothetical protein [Amycolatopsis sp. NBC_01488]
MTRADTGFSISVTEGDDRVLVRLAGDLDENGSGLVALWLTPYVILTPGRPVVLDLTELTAVHHTGWETLADLVELAAYRRCSLELVADESGDGRPSHLDGFASLIPLPAGRRARG